MVDYTKKEMRDETWRRWRGGKKLADDLRAFYTSKTAMDRVARNNGFGSTVAKNGRVKTRGYRMFNLLSGSHQRVLGDSYRRGTGPGRVAAKQASGGLPGRHAPSR